MKPILNMEQIKTTFPRGINKDGLARYYGLTTFDTAIPQSLFNLLASSIEGENKTTSLDCNFHPWEHYVFDYTDHENDNGNCFGALFPLTQEGVDRMENVFVNADGSAFKFDDPRKPC